jgi:hypothetical protein
MMIRKEIIVHILGTNSQFTSKDRGKSRKAAVKMFGVLASIRTEILSGSSLENYGYTNMLDI